MFHSLSLPARTIGAAALAAALALTVAPPPGNTAPAKPAKAAKIVVRANATALQVRVAGEPYGTGVFRAYSTSKRTTLSGNRKPAITLLDGQEIVNLGVLAQNAKNDIRFGRRGARACAGLAATGSTVLSIDQSTCLRPHGGQVRIDSGRLDLSQVEFIRSDALEGLEGLDVVTDAILTALAPVAEQALSTVLTSIGDPAIKLDFAAVTGTCFANRQEAIGRARLDRAYLYAQIGDQKAAIARLPMFPKPNTKVVTDLDQVLVLVGRALRIQLTQGLDGILSPAAPGVQQLIDALNANLVKMVSDQLAPVEENLVDLRLNQQVRPRKNAVRTTSLVLRVLPGAVEGNPAFSVSIGSAACVAPLK